MKSMTGYGLEKVSTAISNIEVSIRSINGRFLDIRFHIPKEFLPYENVLKKIVEKHIERGTVDIYIYRKINPQAEYEKVQINEVLAKKYLTAFKNLSRASKMEMNLDLITLGQLPNVIIIETKTDLSSLEVKNLISVTEKACKACDKERAREGQSLKEDLEKTLSSLEKKIEETNSLREEANQNLLHKMEQRIKHRFSHLDLDPGRIAQELAIQLDKTDINEEISRLKEHLKNYREVLGTKGSVGKKLDFYTQELLREVNTIGSKSNLSQLTHIVVQAKTLIERLREQVQNVE